MIVPPLNATVPPWALAALTAVTVKLWLLSLLGPALSLPSKSPAAAARQVRDQQANLVAGAALCLGRLAGFQMRRKREVEGA